MGDNFGVQGTQGYKLIYFCFGLGVFSVTVFGVGVSLASILVIMTSSSVVVMSSSKLVSSLGKFCCKFFGKLLIKHHFLVIQNFLQNLFVVQTALLDKVSVLSFGLIFCSFSYK